jgi:hypothetical protein
MKYTIEFEMQSDVGGTVSERVYSSLVSAFGSIDRLRILPIRTYVADLQGNKAFVWREVSAHRTQPDNR